MEIWKYLTVLSVIILLVVIGNKVVYENKFATIVGTMTLTANTQDKATNNR